MYAANRILLVEDDVDIQEALTQILTLEGYEVIRATNGQEGLDYLRSAKELPQMILLDLIMPVKDGYQFLAERSFNNRLSELPVIVMTANQMQSSRPAGATGFLRKPVDISVLLDTIRDTIRDTVGQNSP